MGVSKGLKEKLAALGIFAFCLGYFASYIPYSGLTKIVSKGLLPGMGGQGVSGFEIQPVAVFGTFVAMFAYITFAGWWKYATHSKVFGISFPRPQWFTLISGLCTGGIIITTTLAYTFSGISIVFAMLLMRGGVLILAPIVDIIAKKRKRKIYWPSLVAALLSLAAVFTALSGKDSYNLTVVAIVDISLYLGCYFFRFWFMSNKAKSHDTDEMKRYFVEEQMIANPGLLIALLLVGIAGSFMAPETVPGKIWSGFTTFPFQSGLVIPVLLIGIFSYGTGLFGSLIFLDKREHTFCVPANRCSSVVAGVVATYLLAVFFGQKYPPKSELTGVVIILGAIIFLSYRSIIEKRRALAEKKTLNNCCLQAAGGTK